MTGDHQIRELLQQTSALLETRYQAWSEQLQKLEEDTVAKVKETYRGLRKNAEEWKKDGIKHLTAVIRLGQVRESVMDIVDVGIIPERETSY